MTTTLETPDVRRSIREVTGLPGVAQADAVAEVARLVRANARLRAALRDLWAAAESSPDLCNHPAIDAARAVLVATETCPLQGERCRVAHGRLDPETAHWLVDSQGDEPF